MIGYYIYLIISPVLWGFAFLISFIFPKMRERTLAQYSIYKVGISKLKANRQKPTLLFHAASTGEFEQLKPLLLLVDREQNTVVVTFFSATAYRKEKHSTLFDICLYHPLDSLFSAFLFFMKIRPLAYVVNRHDLWPSHLWAARTLGIRTVYINANIHESSKRNLALLKGFNKMLLGQFDLILTGSERLRQNIRGINGEVPVKITGDSRFDQVFARMERNPKNHFSRNPYLNIVLGSVIPSDYPVVLGGIRMLWETKNGHQMGQQLIVVPHEVTKKDIDELAGSLEKHGFSYALYSQTKELGTCDAMIIDCVGILAELYSYGFCAYVGAGFGAGVHSVIEPAVYSIPVAYGPNISLLDEAVEMAGLGIGTVVRTKEDFADFLLMSEKDPALHTERSKEFIESKKGASMRIAASIDEVILESR